MKAACLAMTFAACCLAQPAPSTEKASISGSVIGLTGEPLRRVTLQLTGLPPGREASAGMAAPNLAADVDFQGNFHFDDVPPGRYMLAAGRTGYLPRYYESAHGPVFTLSAGQKLTDIVIRMSPQGIIAGRVVDEEREPLPGLTVTIRAFPVSAKSPITGAPPKTATTDADGAFAIGDLSPGRYLASVSAPSRNNSLDPGLALGTRREAYVTTYYPDAAEIENATPVEVGAGAQVRGLELRLQKVPIFQVRGRVISAVTGAPGPADSVALIRRGSGTPGLASRSTSVRDGEFSFDGVLPGTYTLETKPAAQEGHPTLVGCEVISVGGGDLDRLVVEMKPAIELHGRVVVDGAPVEMWPQITLTPTDGLNYLDSAMVDAAGRFTVSGLEPLRYQMSVAGLEPPMFVKSIRLNGLDVAGGIDLGSATAASLEIVLGYGNSSISGLVSDSGLPVGAAVTVMLVGKDQPVYRLTQTDASGRYSLAGLPAGEYFAAAMDMGPGRLPPEFIERLGKTITVAEGGSTADLRLINFDDLPQN